MPKAEQVVIIPTGSQRKRELIKLFLDLVNGGGLPPSYFGLATLEMIQQFKGSIPDNSNGAKQNLEFLGTWQGVPFFAIANGGEKNLPGLTISDEAVNKAAHAANDVLTQIFTRVGVEVLLVGLDGQDAFFKANSTEGISKGKFRPNKLKKEPTWEEIEEYLGQEIDEISQIFNKVAIAMLYTNREETNKLAVSVIEFGFRVNQLRAKIKELHQQGALDYQASWLGLLQLVMKDEDWVEMAFLLISKFQEDTQVFDFMKQLDEPEQITATNFLMMCQILGVPLWVVLEQIDRTWRKNSVN